MNRTRLIIMMLAVAIMTITAAAGEKAHKMSSDHVTLTGTMVCLGCDLKKSDGARAACTEYGHKHVLKTADGKLVNLLENKYSAKLMTDKFHNKTVEIQGVHYASANTLDVEGYTVDGKKMSWCDHCKSMDACMSKSM